MSAELFSLNKKILNALSYSEERYILIATPEKNTCHWTENSVSILDLHDEETSLDYIWNHLLHPDDRENFFSKYQALLDGSCQRITSECRLLCLTGTYQKCMCDIWIVSSESPIYLAGVITIPDGAQIMDPITALPSNFDFHKTLEHYIAQNIECMIMVIGLDNFKVFNEMYSYSFGNLILKQCAEILRGMIPPNAILFRSDGDGFLILFTKTEYSEIQAWFHRTQHVIQRPRMINGINVCFTISAGLCRFPEDGVDSEVLYRNVVLALRSAKANGKGQLNYYSQELGVQLGIQTKLLARLRETIALGFQGFSMYYQPLVHTQTGSLFGCEALLRWEHEEFPDVSIQTCISCLEECGLIYEMGKWVLETSIRQCAKWISYIPDFCMNINISCQQFENPEFKFVVLDILNTYHVDPSHIILELTESGRVKNSDVVGDVFDFLRSQRLRIAFDDFGTGYASLDIFRKLSADELKIDRSFLERITYDVTDQALLTTLISLCHNMNMLVCVEGIESRELETIMRQMNPDILQGYYYSRPIPVDEFEKKYFAGKHAVSPPNPSEKLPEMQNSMTYSDYRPAQPLRMDHIIEHAYAGIFQVGIDSEFTFMTCNEGYRRMLGYTSAEIEKKFRNHALGFVHPDDMRYVNEEIRRQLGEGDTVTIEFRIVRKDNTPIWIVGTGNVYHSPTGSDSLVVVIIDNDKMKRKQLRRLEKYGLYKKLLNSLPTGIKLVRYDPDFTVDYISPGFLSILGYTVEEIQTVFDGKYINLIYEDDRESVFNDIMEQLQKSDVVTMRYRSPCKDGSLIWMETISRLCPPDPDGVQRACSNVVDVSHFSSSKPPVMNRGLNIANRYETAATQWGEFLFELNLKTNTISFSENFNKIFLLSPQCPLSTAINLVKQQDRPFILRALEQCRTGVIPDSLEVRLSMPDHTDRWFSVAFSMPQTIGDIPVSVLGKFWDIDEEKSKKEELLRQAQHDSLTGLLNKKATENRIREQLASHPDSHFAMFMMDVDGFKQINDSLGHFSGDEVLSKLAEVLRSLFRQNDIVGRVGGDEFMVFINCDGEDEMLIKKSKQLLDAVSRQTIQENGSSIQLTLSIGISRSPENGSQFYELFRNADSALYRAKELGRNRYCLSPK